MASKTPKNKGSSKSSSCAVVYHRPAEALDQDTAFRLPSGPLIHTETIVIGHILQEELEGYEPKYQSFVQKYGGKITVVCAHEVITIQQNLISLEPINVEGTI